MNVLHTTPSGEFTVAGSHGQLQLPLGRLLS
jgi:hypothetical protein